MTKRRCVAMVFVKRNKSHVLAASLANHVVVVAQLKRTFHIEQDPKEPRQEESGCLSMRRDTAGRSRAFRNDSPNLRENRKKITFFLPPRRNKKPESARNFFKKHEPFKVIPPALLPRHARRSAAARTAQSRAAYVML